MDEYYSNLAEALARLPNGFTRTQSGVELEILKRIFTESEAKLASKLTRDYQTIDEIATQNNLEYEAADEQLKSMVNKGMVMTQNINNVASYRLRPFIFGIYEFSLHLVDHSFAHLIEDYFEEGGLTEIMKPLPHVHRVIPAQSAVKSEWILPYDDVKQLLESGKVFHVRDCICRTQQEFVGRKCDFPIHTCLTFFNYERPPRPGDISKQEALDLLDEMEKIGLVHTVSNLIEGHFYVCNCCGCCCGILRGLNEFGLEGSIAAANYYAEINNETCIGCGLCEKRCQVYAISMIDNKAVVDLDKCIGCGLCATGCPVGAATLSLKPEEERIDPPKNFGVWEEKRLENLGMK
jgi:H+/Na+-translocating ferredoxin:NAD+ oxidoreductase subunit B